VFSVLREAFPETSRHQVTRAADAIRGLGNQGEGAWNVPGTDSSKTVWGGQAREVADRILDRTELRVFEKRPLDVGS
jgi:hypothetical protein